MGERKVGFLKSILRCSFTAMTRTPIHPPTSPLNPPNPRAPETPRGEKQGFSMGMRRAESFNVLVAAQIGYFITCRFLKRTTLHYRVFLGNWVAYVSIVVTIGVMVRSLLCYGGCGVGAGTLGSAGFWSLMRLFQGVYVLRHLDPSCTTAASSPPQPL